MRSPARFLLLERVEVILKNELILQFSYNLPIIQFMLRKLT